MANGYGIAVLLFILCSLPATADVRFWILKSADEIAPPPSRGSDEAEEARYWDAGAPNYRWHERMFELFGTSSAPVVPERVSAALHIAIHDAIVFASHHAGERPASLHAAADGAASRVLAWFFPDKAAEINAGAERAARSRVVSGSASADSGAAGLQLGRAVGERMVARLRADGSDEPWTGSVPSDPGVWNGRDPLLPQIARWKTWILQSPGEIRPPAPPKFDEAAMSEVRDAQNLAGTRRRAAFQWAITGLLRYFNEQASQRIFEDRIDRDPVRAAEIYATLNAAYFDALVACWDAKYAYWGERPNQYDPSFKPQITTPNFPGYPSGHAIFAGTASAILAHYFPRDAKRFEKTAAEIASSRLWGGVHFRVDNEVGLEMGKKIAALAIRRTRAANKP